MNDKKNDNKNEIKAFERTLLSHNTRISESLRF